MAARRINTVSIVVAAERGQADRVQFWIDRNVNVDYVESESGMTALHIASKKGFLEVVQVLVEAGASLDLRVKKATDRGATALYLAAKYNKPEVVGYLIENGANKTIKGETNRLGLGGKLPETFARGNELMEAAFVTDVRESSESEESGEESGEESSEEEDLLGEPSGWTMVEGERFGGTGLYRMDAIRTDCPVCNLSLQAADETQQRALAKLECGDIYHLDCLMRASQDQYERDNKFICLACGALNPREYAVPEAVADGYKVFSTLLF